MSTTCETELHRILIIDDNPAIHEDFRKILENAPKTQSGYARLKNALFGEATPAAPSLQFEFDSAHQGKDGVALLKAGLAAGRPYSMAFVDLRMPPGWDGVETIKRLWEADSQLQVVLCTAYSDYGWEDITGELGHSDSLLILKKPFDNIEVLQLAHALTKKWTVSRKARSQMQQLDATVSAQMQELIRGNEALHQEIAERITVEEALRHSEERFSKAFRGSPFAMAILNRATERFVEVNDSFAEMCGFANEEMSGRTQAELGLCADEQVWDLARARMKSEKSIRGFACQLRKKKGDLVDAVLFMEELELGNEASVLLIVEDISHRLQLENQLRQAHKMEAVGQLAAGVAHDFNNILTVIQGHASIRLAAGGLEEKVQEAFTKILKASEKATKLTSQLLAFSRKQTLKREPVDVSLLVDHMNDMLLRLIGEHITLHWSPGADLPCILADRSSIEQVVLNLAVNARDAMANGGDLWITTELASIGKDSPGSHPDAAPGDYICLTVKDTGCGMDERTQSHIFEPFFTSKEVGKGTGMGLATVYGILKQHNGWVEVSSQVGLGTTFSVYLPVTQEKEEADAGGAGPVGPVNGTETILFVEDEGEVRKLVGPALERFGYQVLLAENGVEALKVWRKSHGSIDLLITDLVMPAGINGRQLAEKLKVEKPGLPVVYTSGYSAQALGSDFRAEEKTTFLPKPYQAQLLAETVRKLLAAGLERREEASSMSLHEV